MDEQELAEALDQAIDKFIRKATANATRHAVVIDSFVALARLTLSAPEFVVVGQETIGISVSIEAMVNDAVNMYRQSLAEGAQAGVADVQRRKGAEKEWTWKTESNRPCPDCAARSGQTHSYEYWESIGLPKSGLTICGGYCLCNLVEA
jgi:hypothetical protein